MVLSKKRGPKKRSQDTVILLQGLPNKAPNFWKPPYREVWLALGGCGGAIPDVSGGLEYCHGGYVRAAQFQSMSHATGHRFPHMRR